MALWLSSSANACWSCCILEVVESMSVATDFVSAMDDKPGFPEANPGLLEVREMAGKSGNKPILVEGREERERGLLLFSFHLSRGEERMHQTGNQKEGLLFSPGHPMGPQLVSKWWCN